MFSNPAIKVFNRDGFCQVRNSPNSANTPEICEEVLNVNIPLRTPTIVGYQSASEEFGENVARRGLVRHREDDVPMDNNNKENEIFHLAKKRKFAVGIAVKRRESFNKKLVSSLPNSPSAISDYHKYEEWLKEHKPATSSSETTPRRTNIFRILRRTNRHMEEETGKTESDKQSYVVMDID